MGAEVSPRLHVPRIHVEDLSTAEGDDRPAVTLVHGFTQNSGCWTPFDREMARWGPVRAVDVPGHGRSGPATDGLWATGRAVLAAASAQLHVGYSLGGRILLHGALTASDSVDRLVLIGAHPGIEDPDRRRARKVDDTARAERLERIGLVGFLDEWLVQPMFSDLTEDQSHRRERLANESRPLADALRVLGTGSQDSLWDRLGELAMPVLVLAGEDDDRYREIGQRMANEIGTNATFKVIPGVGHAAHMQDPTRTGAAVLEWLAVTG